MLICKKAKFPVICSKEAAHPLLGCAASFVTDIESEPSPHSAFLCKSLDKSKKCAIIKVRGNTGDGYSLKLAEITANSWKVWAVISFCFAYRLPTLQLQVRKYPVEEDLPKLCTSGITSLRRTHPEEEKEFFTSSGQGGSNRHRQAVPAPNKVCRVQTLSALRLSQQSDMRSVAWCFQGHGFLRGSFIIHPRRRFVKTAFKKPLRRAFSLSAGVCLRGAVCCQIVPDTVSVAVPGVVTQTPSVPCAKVAAGTVIRPGTVANTPVVSL